MSRSYGGTSLSPPFSPLAQQESQREVLAHARRSIKRTGRRKEGEECINLGFGNS
jgi:hypothetical protein